MKPPLRRSRHSPSDKSTFVPHQACPVCGGTTFVFVMRIRKCKTCHDHQRAQLAPRAAEARWHPRTPR